MTSIRCATVAVMALLALQGCGGAKDKDGANDKGICQTSDKAALSGDKTKIELCVKDGKATKGEVTPKCCKAKDELLKKCLKEEANKASLKPAAAPEAAAPEAAAAASQAPATQDAASGAPELNNIVVNSKGRTVTRGQ